MKFISFLWLIVICIQLNAQEVSDAKSIALMKKISKQYKDYKSIEIDFKLLMELAEQKPETINGKMIRKGEMYNLITSKQSVYNDSKAMYIYLVQNNEVQILDPNEKSDNDLMMSPTELFNIAENKKFIYAIIGSGKENGKTCTFVEFKPIKKSSNYAKLRLAVEQSSNKLVSMKAFSKDGSRYTMSITSQSFNKPYSDATFTFDKTKYPKVKVNDLRID
jgi:outer membrane lipoprotein carrier protein